MKNLVAVLHAHAKAVTAVAGAVLSVLTQVYGTANHWILLATVAATALGVEFVPNKAAPAPKPAKGGTV